MQEVLNGHGIKHIFPNPYNPNKVAWVERFIRTLRQLAVKIIRNSTNKRPHNALLDAVKIYNSTPSAVTHMTPEHSLTAKAQTALIEHYMERDAKQQESSVQPKFNIGQLVRLKETVRSHFMKASSPLWHANQYRIAGIVRTVPLPSYKLTSVDGLIHLPATVSQALLH